MAAVIVSSGRKLSSVHTHCTTAQRRSISIRPQAQYEALRARRALERAFGLRRAKYVGPAKVHLQHVLTGAAINFVRVAAWLDEVPLGKARRSAFVKLMLPEPTAVAA